jgi:hypothetical protein
MTTEQETKHTAVTFAVTALKDYIPKGNESKIEMILEVAKEMELDFIKEAFWAGTTTTWENSYFKIKQKASGIKTPEQKAIELVGDLVGYAKQIDLNLAKQLALESVKQIEQVAKEVADDKLFESVAVYWIKVKQEIEKL